MKSMMNWLKNSYRCYCEVVDRAMDCGLDPESCWRS